jgi:hypothetical protein
MERLSAEGVYFHRGCFRCEYCGTTLRQSKLIAFFLPLKPKLKIIHLADNYAFDRDGRYGSRFVCIQHYGLPGFVRGAARARRKSEDLKAAAEVIINSIHPRGIVSNSSIQAALVTDSVVTPRASDQADTATGVTPERVEFENLAGGGSDEEYSEARPASGMAQMDEEAWTDHNFGASCADDSSDDNSDSLT